MFSADNIFAHLVYLAFPAVLLYVLLYGLTCPWWLSWIGRSLLTKAFGVLILISFSALYQWFGPNYWGRDFVRISGMIIANCGFYMALFSLIKVKVDAEQTWKFWHWEYPILGITRKQNRIKA